MSLFPPAPSGHYFLQRASVGFQCCVQLNIVHRPLRVEVCNPVAERQPACHCTSIFTFRGASAQSPSPTSPSSARHDRPNAATRASSSTRPPPQLRGPPNWPRHRPLPALHLRPPAAGDPAAETREPHLKPAPWVAPPPSPRGGRGRQSQALRPQQHFETASRESAISGLPNPSNTRVSGGASGNHRGSPGGLES